MKKILSLLLLVSLIVGSLISLAACGATDGLEYRLLPDGTYGVKVGDAKEQEKIKIPSEHDGKPVTAILPEAFLGCDELVSITIPKSVVTIGSRAFGACYNLAEVKLEGGVVTIGEYTFAGCRSLAEITIPESVTTIKQNAFWCTTSLESVTFENSSGWCYSEFPSIHKTSISSAALSIPETAAEYLKFNFCSKVWQRN